MQEKRARRLTFPGPETAQWGGGFPLKAMRLQKVRALPGKFVASLRKPGKTNLFKNSVLIFQPLPSDTQLLLTKN